MTPVLVVRVKNLSDVILIGKTRFQGIEPLRSIDNFNNKCLTFTSCYKEKVWFMPDIFSGDQALVRYHESLSPSGSQWENAGKMDEIREGRVSLSNSRDSKTNITNEPPSSEWGNKKGRSRTASKDNFIFRHIANRCMPFDGKKFHSKRYFKISTRSSAGVKIGHLDNDFKKYFYGKVENTIRGQMAYSLYALPRASKNIPIVSILGKRLETSLALLWKIIASSGNGKLDSNDFDPRATKIFFIRDTKNKLRSVGVIWCNVCKGWRIYLPRWSANDHGWAEGDLIIATRLD